MFIDFLNLSNGYPKSDYICKKLLQNLHQGLLGPYSQGVIVPRNQQLIFVSGQLPVDPQSGKLSKEYSNLNSSSDR